MLLALTCELLTRHSTSVDRGYSFPVKTIFLDTWQTNPKNSLANLGTSCKLPESHALKNAESWSLLSSEPHSGGIMASMFLSI